MTASVTIVNTSNWEHEDVVVNGVTVKPGQKTVIRSTGVNGTCFSGTISGHKDTSPSELGQKLGVVPGELVG